MTTTVTMPQLGESVVEGTIGKWLVQEGQRVERDQPVVEILTDKADSEVNAPEAGVVTKIHVQEGATITVGEALVDVDANAQATTGGAASKVAAPAKKSTPSIVPPQPVAAAEAQVSAGAGASASASAGSGSPAVRKLAREQGVDLSVVSGSGNGGRVTKDDVM